MSRSQWKITRHAKEQENGIHSQAKKRKIETEVNETKVLELAKKRFNCHAYVQEIKENMLTEMNKWCINT